jgi:RNA polymerase sigma-70 factor (ECF subfamily)
MSHPGGLDRPEHVDTIEAAFHEHRRRVFDVAYRMLGSVSDADDVVQEAYLRLTRADLASIDDVEAWLVTVASRVCLDRLRSAEVKRAAYVGPWLPEPIVGAADVAPDERVTLDESVRMALLVVLDQLSPAERTSFLLHDVFGLPFGEVASVVGRTPAACRQLASRARRRIEADGVRTGSAPSRRQLEQVAHRFAAACRTGRVEDLVAVLDPDATGEFDSGGLIPGAALRRTEGAGRIARGLARVFAGREFVMTVTDVNGEPGVVVSEGGRIVSVIALTSDGERVVALHGIGNPAKLRHLRPSGHPTSAQSAGGV